MPSPQDIEERVKALSDYASGIGLNPDQLELRNSEGMIKSTSRLKDIVNNADVKTKNLQEQADIALHELDARASIATATMTQAQAEFLKDAIDLLNDESPGVDPAKLQKATQAIDVFKETSTVNTQVANTVEAARLKMYSDVIRDATQDTLKARGFTDADVQTFATATTRQLMAGQADLKTTLEMAQPIAQSMNQNLQTCTTRMSDIDPAASKIHDAVAQSFNTAIKVDPDGDRSLKPKLEGNETGTFSLRKADQFVKEAAAENGVTLSPARPLHQQLESSPLHHVGGSLKADKSASAMAGQQASITFKVTSEQPLDEAGATLAFAKRGFGAKTQEMKTVIGHSESDIMRAEFKDNELAGTAAPLFGTAAEVSQTEDLRGTMAVIGGDLNSLQSRAVATSAVNKALGMNSVAEEKIGMDEDRRTVGISVAVAGAPILTRPNDAAKNESFLDIEYNDAKIQKGLSDLEVQDYITGQIDRHAGNIFVDPTSKEVRGIDNDLAFPVVDREAMLTDKNLSAKAVRGMPQFIHEDTASKIEALSPQELRTALQNLPVPGDVPGLEPAAIEGAVTRLEKLQAEIKNMRAEGRVVPEFNEKTYQAAKEAQLALCNPEMGVGERGNAGVPRTSYVGTAIMEQERTKVLNQSDKSQDHRNMLKEGDMRPLPVSEHAVAYKKGLETAQTDLLQNPHKIADMKVAGEVANAQKKVTELETKLAAQTQDMQAMKSTHDSVQRGLESPQQQQRLKQSLEALKGAQTERQSTLQELSQAKKELASSLDKAVEPLKPQIHRATGLEVLQKEVLAANQKVTESQQNLNQAQNSTGIGSHRLVAAAQAELDGKTQAAQLAAQKLNQFDQATQGAEVPRNTVAQSMGRARSNSLAPGEKVGNLDEKPAAQEVAQEGQNQGWGAKPSAGGADSKQSTRAALGRHRQNDAPQAPQQQTKVRSNSIG